MSIKNLVPDYYLVRHSSSELDSTLTYRNNFIYFDFDQAKNLDKVGALLIFLTMYQCQKVRIFIFIT